MSKKFFLFLVIIFVLFSLFFSYLNHGEVSIILWPGGSPLSLSIPKLAIGSFLIGVISISIFFLLFIFEKSRRIARERKFIKGEVEKKDLVIKALKGYLLGMGERSIDELSQMKDDFEVNFYKALLLWKLKGDGEIKEILENLRVKEGYNEDVYLLEAFYLADQKGDLRKASELLETVLKEKPKDVFVLRKLRDVLIDLGEWEKALDVANRVLKISGGKEDEDVLVGIEYELMKRSLSENPKGVSKRARKLLKKYPDFLPLYLILAESYEKMGDRGKEIGLFEELVDQRPDPAILKFIEGYYMKRGNPDGILDFYKKALARTGNDPKILFLYGSFCERVELLEEALDAYNRIESEGCDSPILKVRKASVYREMGRKDDYLAQCDDALRDIEKSLKMTFVCERCGSVSEEWRDFCEKCRRWNVYKLQGGNNFPGREKTSC